MSTIYIAIVISITLAALGLIIELSSNRRVREYGPDCGKRPSFVHRNFKLMGDFNYRSGRVYYHCLCIGPFPFAPMGCYVSTSRKGADIQSSQKSKALEVFALYSRWGWLVTFVSIIRLIA